MNPVFLPHFPARPLRRLAAAALMVLAAAAHAGPGAHGPDGEHLDGPAPGAAGPGGSHAVRLEARSELFELVANLQDGRLSILIDRYDTNEPVLNAGVEVETGALKAKAAFQADQGGYAVSDAAFLQAVAAPGEHALVFTVVAGNETDLLDGMLVTGNAAPAADDHGHDHGHGDGHDHGVERAAWAGAVVLGLGVFSLVAWLRQRRRAAAPLAGNQP
jgi:hypothetical protein